MHTHTNICSINIFNQESVCVCVRACVSACVCASVCLLVSVNIPVFQKKKHFLINTRCCEKQKQHEPINYIITFACRGGLIRPVSTMSHTAGLGKVTENNRWRTCQCCGSVCWETFLWILLLFSHWSFAFAMTAIESFSTSLFCLSVVFIVSLLVF